MARPPRVNIPGATYHVMARGNRKETLFRSDRDRYRFRDMLAQAASTASVEILADCQMSSHFHAVVCTPRANLPEFMQHLDSEFGQYLNRTYDRVGHVFQGRYKGVIVDHDLHLVTTINYVLANPLDGGLVNRAEDWKWSSYAATVGLANVPPYLSLDWLDTLFPDETREASQALFRTAFEQPRPIDSYLAQPLPAVGSEGFRRAVRSFVGERLYQSHVPRAYRALCRPSLDEMFSPEMSRYERALAIQRARVVHGYKLSEVARSLGMHAASVSRIVCSLRKDRKKCDG